jgi:hypothetical protein
VGRVPFAGKKKVIQGIRRVSIMWTRVGLRVQRAWHPLNWGKKEPGFVIHVLRIGSIC